MTKLTPQEVVKLDCFIDPTEHIVVTDFEWYWSFHENKCSDISRLFCGVYILGFFKESKEQQKLFEDLEIEDIL